MKNATKVLILATIHFVVSVALVATVYSLSMDRFDTGASPGPVERVLESATEVLLFPVVRATKATGLRLPPRSDIYHSSPTASCGLSSLSGLSRSQGF
jgi:hypothetical protein